MIDISVIFYTFFFLAMIFWFFFHVLLLVRLKDVKDYSYLKLFIDGNKEIYLNITENNYPDDLLWTRILKVYKGFLNVFLLFVIGFLLLLLI